MTNVLAFDFGGSSLRAALVDAEGSLRAFRSVRSEAGQATEIDPEVWWRELAGLADALALEAPVEFDAAGAVAISAFTRTQVLLDAEGRPVRPALLWHDARCATFVEELKSSCPPGHPEAARLNAFHPAARLLWLARTEPAAMARVAHVVEPKDWLNLRLTGTLAVDDVASARLLAAARPAGASLFDALGIKGVRVPPVRGPVSVVGSVTPGLPGALGRLAGLPVATMANDTWAAVAGLGALRPGYAYCISGTTEVLGLVSGGPCLAEGLLDVVWGPALHQLGGPGQNGADTLTWALDLLGRGGAVGDALSLVLAVPRQAAPLLFLPYLQGERVPYWDADLRGALVGLGRHHGASDVAWAVMEGVAFLNRVVLERAEAGAGAPAGELRLGGGGAANATWCQIRADVLGRPIVAPATDEPGLLGASAVARAACGEYPTLDSAQAALVRPGRSFVPDPARRAHYDALYATFRAAHVALAPVSRRLATWAPDRR